MAACPDSSCHEKLKTVCEKVHNESTGLSSKVSRSSLTKTTVSLLAIMAMLLVAIMVAWGAAKDERKENAKQVEVVKKTIELEFTHVKEKLDQQITTGDIYRVVKRVMRENGDDP